MAVLLWPESVISSVDMHCCVVVDGEVARGATVFDWYNQRRDTHPVNVKVVKGIHQAFFEKAMVTTFLESS